MSRTFFTLFVVAMVGIVVTWAEPEIFAEPERDVQMYTDVALVPSTAAREDDSAVDHVTPYDYKAVMTKSSKSGRKVLCWRCSSPCSNGFCCDDGFPQCCLLNGLCKCCRR